MGYDIEQRATRFHVAAENVARAYALACTLRSPDAMADAAGAAWCGGETSARWYAFVHPGDLAAADDLVSFLTAFRWTPTVAADGSITHLTFRGTRADQSQLLFEAIAEAVSVGCFIEMLGEDDAAWRWVFDGTACRLDLLTPSQWGPGWLLASPDDAAAHAEPAGEPPAPWASDGEGWRG